LVGEAEVLAVHHLACLSALDGSAAHSHFSLPSILRGMLLGVTFPFLIFYAEFLQFWQLRKHDSHVAVNGV
jgi:hypothetical protein